MSSKRRASNLYRTPSPVLEYTPERARSHDRRKFKSCVGAGISSPTWTNPPNTTPTTPPASSTHDSLPSLSITPSSIRSLVIQTPGTTAFAEVLPRHLYFPEELSPTHESYLTDGGNRKSSHWMLEPDHEIGFANKPKLEIGQCVEQPKTSNDSRDVPVQKEEIRESHPAVPEFQVVQSIVRPSTPEHQIIRPYCAPADPDVAAWILGCRNSDEIGTPESHNRCNDFVENDRIDFIEEHTAYLAPLASPASPQNCFELVRKYLDHLPDNIVIPLLTSLEALFKSNAHALTTAASTASASVSFDSTVSRSAQENPRSISNSKKRISRGGDGEPPDTDDENPRKKRKSKAKSTTSNRRRWACPFYQREPHRYSVETKFGDFRKCARSPGFDLVHRVKEHIKECHSPIYCERCFALFETSGEHKIHQRRSPACDLEEHPSIKLLTDEQKDLLKPRIRNVSEEERWNTIYKICFPEDQTLPSPYYIHYSHELNETQSQVLRIIEEETRIPGEVNRDRLLLRVNEVFNTRRSATVASQNTFLLTPSTGDDSNGSTDMSFHTQARENYTETPSKHCSERMVLAIGSGNNASPVRSGLLEPPRLPEPSNNNQIYSSDDPKLENEIENRRASDFGDSIRPLDFEQTGFSNVFGLLEDYGGLGMALGDIFADDTSRVFD